jgi:hypothetical protein
MFKHIPFIIKPVVSRKKHVFLAKVDVSILGSYLKKDDFDKLNELMRTTYGPSYYWKPLSGWIYKSDPTEILQNVNLDVKHEKMAKGGLLDGPSHNEGGIKKTIKSTKTDVELEGGEAVINKNTVKSQKTYEFEGEQKKPIEILSELNQDGGGVPIMRDGGKITNTEIKKESKEHLHTFQRIERKQIKTPEDLGKSIAQDHNQYAKGGRFSENVLKYNAIPKEVKDFMPPMQAKFIYSSTYGMGEFQDAIENLMNQIKSLPMPYGSENNPDPICWLHYFYAGSDWYVIENDSEPEKLQCFGWVILNNDFRNAESGYINVEELKASNKVQLDFYWTPIPLSEVKAKHNPEVKTHGHASQSDLWENKKQEQITIEIRALIDKNGLDFTKYTPAELQYLRKYEGMGSLAKSSYVHSLDIDQKGNILDQFFTPDIVIKYMWGLAVKYGFGFKYPRNILEPSVGTGRFLEYIPENHNVDAFDIDYYSYVISKLSFPKFNIQHASLESLFFQGNRHVGLNNIIKRYDLVIGNPPYREYTSKFSKIKGSEGNEKEITKAHTFDQYMIARGVDLLKPGGLLVFIIPNSFLANDNKYNEFKEQLATKAELLTAYRLPNGVFDNTEIGTDIIVLKRK